MPIIPEDYEKLKDESLEEILYGMKKRIINK